MPIEDLQSSDPAFRKKVRDKLGERANNGLRGKPDRWLDKSADRADAYLSKLPANDRARIRTLKNEKFEEWLTDRILNRQGLLIQGEAQENGTPIDNTPGGDSNYSGTWQRVTYPSGYVDVCTASSPYPATRQQVWFGLKNDEYFDQEVLFKSDSMDAIQEWAIDQGFGESVTDEFGQEQFVWYSPVNVVRIRISDSVYDANGDVAVPAVLSNEFHGNLQVI